MKEESPAQMDSQLWRQTMQKHLSGESSWETPVIEQGNVGGHVHLNLGFRPKTSHTDVNPHPTLINIQQSFIAVYQPAFWISTPSTSRADPPYTQNTQAA